MTHTIGTVLITLGLCVLVLALHIAAQNVEQYRWPPRTYRGSYLIMGEFGAASVPVFGRDPGAVADFFLTWSAMLVNAASVVIVMFVLTQHTQVNTKGTSGILTIQKTPAPILPPHCLTYYKGVACA